MVTILDKGTVAYLQVGIEYPLEVRGRILKIDEMVFHLLEFDLVLRMDRRNELSKLRGCN